MFPKYFKLINNTDTFDKLITEALVRHGYKIVKIGSGNFLTNPSRLRPLQHLLEGSEVLSYISKPCPMCQPECIPDRGTLSQMLEEAVMTMGGADEL